VAKVARLSLERIGRVRLSAGRCLQRLLQDIDVSSLQLPDAFARSAMNLTDDELQDGRAAARLLQCGFEDDQGCLAPELLLGAVYAIGGLDADLRDFTTDHAISCFSSAKGQHGLGDVFLSLWMTHVKSPRLSGPFLQTADAILSRTDLITNGRFVASAIDATLETIQGSGDVGKLCKAAVLLGTLAGEEGEVRARAATSLVSLMGRKYPKVRMTAAEELYTAMLTWDDDDEDEDLDHGGVLSILTGTTWGASAPVLLREQRLKLAEKLASKLN
jgi:hypothetical protein